MPLSAVSISRGDGKRFDLDAGDANQAARLRCAGVATGLAVRSPFSHLRVDLTGENPPYGAGPQPGGREPAPGELALVQAFRNTHFDLASGGGEMLASPEALRAWLSERGLLASGRPVDGRGLDRVLAVREGIRALAFANNTQDLNAGAVDAMREASRGATTEIRVGAGVDR